MDYGRLIGDAWNMTWRHRFLWILALFAPTGFGGCGANFNVPANFTAPSSGRPSTGPPGTSPFGSTAAGSTDIQQVVTAMGAWVMAHLGLLLGLAAVGFILFLLFIFLYFVAQGGLASATLRLARGQPESFGPAWRAGLHYFWRYVGLWLLEVVVFIVVAALIAILVAGAIVLVRQVGGGAAIGLGIILGLVGLALVLAALIGLILFNVVITYGQRIIVDEDAGPLTAIRRGIALIRARLGTSLLLWLINFGLGIGIGIANVLVDVIILIPLGIVGAIFVIAFHFSAITIAYIVLAAVVFFAAAWLISAIGNTFMWNYWTLGYLRLEETGVRMQSPEGGTPSP